MTRKLAIAAAGLVFILVVLSAGFVWDEARKEVVFLCGNFRPGVTEISVIRQLETANLLRIQRPSPGHIHVDSAYNFGLYRCLVEVGEAGIVVAVTPP